MRKLLSPGSQREAIAVITENLRQVGGIGRAAAQIEGMAEFRQQRVRQPGARDRELRQQVEIAGAQRLVVRRGHHRRLQFQLADQIALQPR
jgi:hypothetical protein